jgi:hypothetical protein
LVFECSFEGRVYAIDGLPYMGESIFLEVVIDGAELGCEAHD